MTNMQNNTDENFNEDFERLLKQFVSEKIQGCETRRHAD